MHRPEPKNLAKECAVVAVVAGVVMGSIAIAGRGDLARTFVGTTILMLVLLLVTSPFRPSFFR